MTDYTAEDGLNILGYLGITKITEEEKRVFREKWDQVYQAENRNLVLTIWQLYSKTLPFTCGDRGGGSVIVQTVRDKDFDRRVRITRLEEELSEGKSLQDILKKGPHKFILGLKL